MIFVTLFAIACSWFAVKMQQARRQREAVEAIQKLGGAAYYDYQFVEWDVPLRTTEPPEPAWLRKLVGDDFFADVVAVLLTGMGVTDASLNNIKKLPQLRQLDLYNTNITDSGMEYLADINLKCLNLSGTKITDEGLKNLKGMPNLTMLLLYKTNITKAGVNDLQKALPNLKIER